MYLELDYNIKIQKMKNKDLLRLKEAIKATKRMGSNKYNYPMILNEMEIDRRIDALQQLIEPSASFKEFEQKKNELITTHAEKSESGQVNLYDRSGKLIDLSKYSETDKVFGFPKIAHEKDEYEKSFKELHQSYKAAIEEQQKKEQEYYSETLEEVCEIELKSVPFEDFPEMDYELMKVFIEFNLVGQ